MDKMRASWQGERLRMRRKLLGLTMNQLAEMVSCDRPLISMWESNKARPTGHFLVLLGVALRIEPKDLYLIENQGEEESNDNIEQ